MRPEGLCQWKVPVTPSAISSVSASCMTALSKVQDIIMASCSHVNDLRIENTKFVVKKNIYICLWNFKELLGVQCLTFSILFCLKYLWETKSFLVCVSRNQNIEIDSAATTKGKGKLSFCTWFAWHPVEATLKSVKIRFFITSFINQQLLLYKFHIKTLKITPTCFDHF